MPETSTDLEKRVKLLESKVDLIMKVASVTKRAPSTLMPGEFVTQQLTLGDLFKELHPGESE